MKKPGSTTLPSLLQRALIGAALWLGCVGAQAQFQMVPPPATAGPPAGSAADTDKAYRVDGARHLYATYPTRILRGMMPPLMYSVMVVETTIDGAGLVTGVSVVRPPAAPEVGPWVIAMIRRAAPFPAPARLPGGTAKYFEVWLVDKSGLFQVDTLTEGQR